MKRHIIYNIQSNIELSVRDFLKSKGYSHHILVGLKNTDNSVYLSCLDGVNKAVYLNYVLKSGDILNIIISDEIPSENIEPIYFPINIVYEDEDIIVINKPAGMPIHPSINNHDNTLANALAFYYYSQDLPFVFRCINRLDRDTTGLTVIAKNPLSSAILSQMVKDRKIDKIYYAICEGEINTSGTINLGITRKPGSTIERIVDNEIGECAITHYERISTISLQDTNNSSTGISTDIISDADDNNSHIISLARIRLETGRTHQIRVHFKHIGHPLIGDFLYNPSSKILTRQALHCGNLSFSHPITGVRLTFEAPLPDDMSSILKK